MFEKKEFDTDLYVLRDLNWTGTILMAPYGEPFGAEAIELCQGFSNGSLHFLLDRSGAVVGRGADHGDCEFPKPCDDHRLCLVSAEPMLIAPRLLDAMSYIYPMTDVGPEFSERDRSEGAQFLIKIREAGIGLSHNIEDSPSP